MKTQTLLKRLIFVGALFLVSYPAFGLSYLWSKGNTPYTPISGTSLTFSTPDNGYAYINLPFTFTYDSLAYNYVYVGSNGLLGVGTSSVTSIANQNLFTTASPMGVIAPWWDDLIDDDTSTVQWLVSGVMPNRVLTIQFAVYPSYNALPRSRLNFQVKLFETSNQIHFLYGEQIGTANANPLSSASIGIKDWYTGSSLFIEGTTGSDTAVLPNLHSATDFPAANTFIAFGPDTLVAQGLQALGGNRQVTLNWRRSRLDSLAYYRIYRGTSATQLVLVDSTASPTDTSFLMNGLTNGTLYYFAVKAIGTSGFESRFSNTASATPTTPPLVAIVQPVQDTLLRAGFLATLSASASDSDGTVMRVEYYLGTTYVGVSYSGPTWQTSWYPSAVGNFQVTARAYDNLGAVTVSAPVNVRVRAAPIVSLTSPMTGIYTPGTSLTLTASASQASGTITRVEFFNRAGKIGEDTTAPYTLA